MGNISSDLIVWFSGPFCLIFRLLSILLFGIFIMCLGFSVSDGEPFDSVLAIIVGIFSFGFYRTSKFFQRAILAHDE